MKSFIVIALGIAFKIWIIAVLINTIADTLLLRSFPEDVAEMFFLIALFSGLFSAPIFLVIWTMLYSFLKRGRDTYFILKWLLVVGIGMAIAAWAFFTGSLHLMNSEMIELVIAAPLSGAIAIYAGYANIKRACIAGRNEQRLPEGFDPAQPTPGTDAKDIIC